MSWVCCFSASSPTARICDRVRVGGGIRFSLLLFFFRRRELDELFELELLLELLELLELELLWLRFLLFFFLFFRFLLFFFFFFNFAGSASLNKIIINKVRDHPVPSFKQKAKFCRELFVVEKLNSF